jgi:hypothetical protein
MEGTDRKRCGLGPLERQFSGGRLEKQILARVFELAVPILSRRIGRRTTSDRGDTTERSPAVCSTAKGA